MHVIGIVAEGNSPAASFFPFFRLDRSMLSFGRLNETRSSVLPRARERFRKVLVGKILPEDSSRINRLEIAKQRCLTNL